MLRSIAPIAAAILFAVPVTAGENGGGPSQVVVHQRGHGWTLTDAKGMTLYTYEKDVEPGKSECVGPCAQQWPPLSVTADADRAQGEWSVITRDDGSKQWAYRSQPLYYSSRDSDPGDANGDSNQWRPGFKPISTPPGIGLRRSLLGYVLADQKNMTLYSFDKDKPDVSNCDVACTETWMPILAPMVARGFGDWTVLTRKDGTRQWAFKGKPVYRYVNDVHPGETSGDKVGKGWHAVVLEPALPQPTWVTVQQSDAGPLFGDAEGRTLYAMDPLPRLLRTGSVMAPKFDRPNDWTPVLAQDGAQRVGNWSIVNHDGKKQWAYKGQPLFTNKFDVAPGDLSGIRQGDKVRVQPIFRVAGA